MSAYRCARVSVTTVAFLAGALAAGPAEADQGGISFWIPGFFGSLAAAPQVPGFSWATIYYHTSVNANANAQFRLGGNIVAGVLARADMGFMVPTYVFEEKILGAQASLSMLVPFGHLKSAAGAVLTGPNGGVLEVNRADTANGFGDLAPMGSLRWNSGVHNFMTYLTADVPVGLYDRRSLANLGLGHWSLDSGVGYTFFDEKNGNEFSAVLGFTYNFINPSTQYKNGLDMHLDMATSHFLTKEWQIGMVGYVYQQLTGDSGSGAVLGPFKSRVFGIGPQIGHIFQITDKYQGYVNFKGYREFESDHRPEGWNVWLTLQISPAPPSSTSSTSSKSTTSTMSPMSMRMMAK